MSFTNSIKNIPGNIGSYQLHWATPAHATEIADLVNDGYQREITRKVGTLRYPDQAEISDEIKKIDHVGWIILKDPSQEDKIIGSLQLVQEESGKHKVNGFAIDKAYSGKKLGTSMLKEMETSLKQKGVHRVYLEVISVAKETLPKVQEWITKDERIDAEDDPLAAFYQKQGFNFTDISILTPFSWQEECRKTEYVGRVFFREMCKVIPNKLQESGARDYPMSMERE